MPRTIWARGHLELRFAPPRTKTSGHAHHREKKPESLLASHPWVRPDGRIFVSAQAFSVAATGGSSGELAASCVAAAQGYTAPLYERNPWLGGKAAALALSGCRDLLRLDPVG